MTKYVNFYVDGVIVGKQRPRFVRRGNFVSTYTPKKTLSFEESVADAYRHNYPAGMTFDKGEPIEIGITFIFKMPDSWSKKKKEVMCDKPCMKKPDLDNCMKSIMDGLQGVAYPDDNQITDDSRSRKRWGYEERVEITLKNIEEE